MICVKTHSQEWINTTKGNEIGKARLEKDETERALPWLDVPRVKDTRAPIDAAIVDSPRYHEDKMVNWAIWAHELAKEGIAIEPSDWNGRKAFRFAGVSVPGFHGAFKNWFGSDKWGTIGIRDLIGTKHETPEIRRIKESLERASKRTIAIRKARRDALKGTTRETDDRGSVLALAKQDAKDDIQKTLPKAQMPWDTA